MGGYCELVKWVSSVPAVCRVSALDGVVVILVGTDGSENAGSVARLCGNFGVELRFVAVRAELNCKDALKMAHPREEALLAAPRFESLTAATTDCALVVGTSSKIGDAMDGAPLDVARAAGLLPADGERTALVFGNERTGLSLDDAARCHRLMRLPTPGPVDSLNLASAVAVALTLFAEAARPAPAPRADVTARAALRDALEDGLDRRGFYKGKGPEGFRPRLNELISKMDISTRDAELLCDLVAALAGDDDHR